MNIDWHKVHTYTGDKLALVKSGSSRLPRVYRGEKAAKTKAERRRLRPGKISTSGKNKGKPKKNPGVSKSLAIGNMQGEFGVTVNGHFFHTVEAAYITGLYSQKATGATARKLVEIQQSLLGEERGLSAKRHWRQAERGQCETIEEYEKAKDVFLSALKYRRADWSKPKVENGRPVKDKDGKPVEVGAPWHYEWMLFLFWSKIEQNPNFAKRIRTIPKTWKILEVVGDNNASPDWGCREVSAGVWKGENHFGVIATECRRAILDRDAPRIDWEELNRRGIYLFGERLTFAPLRPLPKEFYSALASERQRAHCREAGKASAKARAATFGEVAATIGAKGGKVKSAAKAEAARRNILKAIAARKAKAAAKSKA